jgi:hypothetical protein
VCAHRETHTHKTNENDDERPSERLVESLGIMYAESHVRGEAGKSNWFLAGCPFIRIWNGVHRLSSGRLGWSYTSTMVFDDAHVSFLLVGVVVCHPDDKHLLLRV